MAIKDIVKGICNITRCKYDVYTKEKTDELLEEVNTTLGAKANSSDVYTKTETDDLLDTKANSSNVYSKTETYSQTETNNLLSAKLNSSSIRSGTSNPSGGNDGDIYFQYQ